MRRPAMFLLGAIVVALLAVEPVAVAGRDHADRAPVASDRARLADRPNIVLISTDDQSVAEMRWMPQTRALLGAGGATFRNAFAPQPLCCPARAQILTGQYAQNNGVRSNSGPHGGVDAFEPTEPRALPVWLQNAGYRTGFLGKYLNQYNEGHGVPSGWDHWDATVDGLFDYYGFGQYDGSTVTRPEGHHNDYLARASADFIRTSAAEDRPFFLWASYVAPHGTCLGDTEGNCAVPPVPATRDADRYASVRAPFADSPGVHERGLGDKPRWVLRKGRGRVDPKDMQRLFTQRIRTLASADDAVASTVDSLAQAGELDNTFVAFVSDNGYLFGEHRYTGKIVAYEESVRVPMLLRGPGIPHGVTRRQDASLTDLAPTFAAIAGARPLLKVDGENLLPWARRDARQRDRALLVQAGWRGPDPHHRRWLFRGVRTGRYTYVPWRTEDLVELYDRRRDPFQLHSRGDDPRYAQIARRLDRLTHRLAGCSGASCRRGFRPLPPPR